jgi:cytochrome P450
MAKSVIAASQSPGLTGTLRSVSARAADLDLPFVDLATISDRDAARAAYVAAGRDSWLVRTDIGFAVTRHADVSAVLRDQRWHSLVSKLPQLLGVTDEEFLAQRKGSILSSEGMEHARLRRLVAGAFVPTKVDRFRPDMREVMGELIERVRHTGEVDLVAEICEPYPIPIICRLLGAPESDLDKFSQWATDVLAVFDMNLHEDLPRIKKASAELADYVAELVERRRREPANDLLTDLIAAEEEGDRLDTEELCTMVEAVLLGGTDTTRNQLGCSVAFLLDRPDLWKQLADDPSTAPAVVEETMRLAGAVRGTGRFASEEIEFNGVVFDEGAVMNINLSVANLDESVYPAGLDFQPDQRQHMTFGSGIHFCLGAALARAELAEALPMLAQAMPDIHRNGESTWKNSFAGIYGPTSLPLAFTPT